jgi:hypothetical protein
MNCSHCGEKIADMEDKYCQNCGAEVFVSSKSSHHKPEEKESATEPKIYKIQESHLKRGPAGRFSKLCLGLAIISILLGLIPLIVGINLMRYMYLIFNEVRDYISIALFIPLVIGLVLGILSKIYGSRAEMFEPKNYVERTGSILLVFGILLNITGLVLSFLSPLAIFYL